MRKALAFIIIIPLILIIILSCTGCANIVPPSGGPRDSTPPQLINSTPPDSTRNFRSDRIVLTFDEFVRIEDLSNNLLFTPTFERNPEIAERGRTITIRFRDTLSSNTTYILNFGNAIRDINESNVLRNFVYTFSTGPTLDSLELIGNVVLAQTGNVDSTLIVVLHRNLSDSAIMKDRPIYISRLDAKGNFRFRNLPGGSFAIYALGDAGFSRRYTQKTQLFAFADAPVIPGQTKEITLNAYREVVPAQRTTTMGVRVPAGTDRRLQFATNFTGNQQDLQNDLTLTFTSPLRTFDSTKVSLADTTFTRVAYSVRLDTSRKEIRFRTAWRPGTKYNLIIDRDFAEDTAGRKLLKSDTLFFTTRKHSDYGKLSLRIRNLDASKNPVLQFVQNEQVVFSAPMKSGAFTQDLFVPGEYELRILYDTNGNGKWDPGQFPTNKRQPEIVRPIERRITVKANTDNEFDISL